MRRSLLLLAAIACSKPEKVDDQPAAAAVVADSVAIKAGAIGPSGEAESSYVLVDVRNDSKIDRLVAVRGHLVDRAGRPVAALGVDELRVPAGAARAFALVADKVATDAERATFEVVSAIAVAYPPAIELTDRQEKRGDLLVETAAAKNLADRTASAVLACAYHDAAGKLLARPFTVVDIAPGASRTLRFEGPKEAARAEVFVGQVAFKP